MNTDVMSTLQTIIIIITVIIFFGRMFFGVFKRFSPFEDAGVDDHADFNISDYNIVNIDTDTGITTDNDANNRVGINSSSEAENVKSETLSSAEEGGAKSGPREFKKRVVSNQSVRLSSSFL